MDLRRLRAGEWIAALSGLALLVSLFLPWYAVDDGDDVTAWQALAVSDVLIALAAAAAVCLALVTAGQRVHAVPVAMDALVALAGLAAVLLVLVRVVWIPEQADGRAGALWLGLAGALGIFAGAWLAMRDERRGAEPAPDIEPLPPPRPS